MRLRGANWAVILRTLCAIALLSLGMSHRVPVTTSLYPATELSNYVLPDGTIPELCHSLDDEKTHGSGRHDTVAAVCEACRIVAGILIPAPWDVTGASLPIELAIAFAAEDDLFVAPVLVPAALPRAPPTTGLA